MWKDFEKNAMIWGTNFLWFALIMVVGVVVVRLLLIPIRKALKMSKGEHTAKTFAFSVIRVTLYGAVVITALGTAGVNITSLITALGAAALTAGLAFQDILKNFLSGMILLFTKPITAGDLIEVDGFEGLDRDDPELAPDDRQRGQLLNGGHAPRDAEIRRQL